MSCIRAVLHGFAETGREGEYLLFKGQFLRQATRSWLILHLWLIVVMLAGSARQLYAPNLCNACLVLAYSIPSVIQLREIHYQRVKHMESLNVLIILCRRTSDVLMWLRIISPRRSALRVLHNPYLLVSLAALCNTFEQVSACVAPRQQVTQLRSSSICMICFDYVLCVIATLRWQCVIA